MGTSVVRAVNELRAAGCDGRSGSSDGLRADDGLDRVAQRLAKGAKLRDAINDGKFRAPRSTSIRLSRANDPATLHRMLRSEFCAEVTDPQFRAIGVATRGNDTWIVLALPFTPPSDKEADQVRAQILTLANQARSQARRCGKEQMPAVASLTLDPLLTAAAREHSGDMARQGALSHVGSDGSTPADRATRAKYAWRSVAENVAAGQLTAQAVMQSWLESPGHCLNLMSPRYTQMGAAFVVDRSSPDGIYWTQLFAAPR